MPSGGKLDDDEDDDNHAQRSFTILYGTQSGNSHDVADRIARQARRRHIATRVYAMDQYDIGDLINEALIVVVVGTTGNGDFPASAQSFWRFLLRADLPTDILSDVTFATFGLGDSSYKRFCWPVRKMNKRLSGLGAHQLMSAGEADDQHYLGIDGALRPWLDELWATLDHLLPTTEPPVPDDVQLPPTIEVRLKAGKTNGSTSNGSSSRLEPGWRMARVTRNERITAAEHWQDVRLIEFKDDEGKPIDYRPTDVLSVIPENAPADVQHVLDRLGWTDVADDRVELRINEANTQIPSRLASVRPLTLRRLLATYLDFKCVPRPSFFERILPFTPHDHMQREKLQEYCTPGEGADDMYEYAIRVRRTIMEVLDEFNAVQVPVSHALDVFPTMQRREFSIASAPTQHGASVVQLAVAIVDYKTRLKERRTGVCTSWLARLETGTHVPVLLSPSAMLTTALRNHRAPAIFVGPGTGVAPIRSALWARFADACATGAPMRARDNLCFFGCRNKDKDYLFSDEWRTLTEQGCIEAHLAASRDQPDKVYVQDCIEQQQERVWSILCGDDGASEQEPSLVYICGSAGKMPQAVRAAIVGACQTQGKMSEEEAEGMIDRMEQQGRWIEECWD